MTQTRYYYFYSGTVSYGRTLGEHLSGVLRCSNPILSSEDLNHLVERLEKEQGMGCVIKIDNLSFLHSETKQGQFKNVFSLKQIGAIIYENIHASLEDAGNACTGREDAVGVLDIVDDIAREFKSGKRKPIINVKVQK